MKNLKKFVSILVLAAMFSAIPGVGTIGGMVAWAFEVTPVDGAVYNEMDGTVTVDDVVYSFVDAYIYGLIEVTDDFVYDTVDGVVYDTVDEVVYETVEDAVYETVEGNVYYTGLSADVFALIIDEPTASVFGEIKESDVAPVIKKNRTMLPARFVAENLGAEVEWTAEERKVTVKNETTTIEIVIDSEVAKVNGEEVALDSPAFIENNRTYTPVRFIVENLGANIEWNAELRMVTITKAVEEAPAEEEAVVEDAETEEAEDVETEEAPVEE